jgi:hypothetical protein
MEWFIYGIKFFLFWVVIGFLGIMIWFLRETYRNYRADKRLGENLYMMKYIWLRDRINNIYPVDENNYKELKNHLILLGEMKFKDKEKTSVLWTNLLNGRFKDFADEDIEAAIKKDDLVRKGYCKE